MNRNADPVHASSVPVRSPLWLAVWLITVTIGILGFLQVGMAALSH